MAGDRLPFQVANSGGMDSPFALPQAARRLIYHAQHHGWHVWRATTRSVIVFRDPEWTQSAVALWQHGRFDHARARWSAMPSDDLSLKQLHAHIAANPGRMLADERPGQPQAVA